MTTRKHSPRYFRALALEPRILLDAAAVATVADVAAQVDAPATAEAPGVEARPVDSTITITDSTTSFPLVNLFDDVQVTLDGSGSAPAELVIDVSASGANQALLIDGQEIALLAGQGTTDNHRYQVSLSGSTATVTLSLSPDAASATDLGRLIDGIAYRTLDSTVASGTIDVTLKTLSDTNGDVADLSAISTTVTVVNQSTSQFSETLGDSSEQAGANLLVADDQGPKLGAETGALDLAERIFSDDFPNPYQGIQGVVSMGDDVYAVRTTSEWVYDETTGSGADVQISNLYIYQRNQDGTLSLQETLAATPRNGLNGAWDIGASADGGTLFVSNSEGVTLFHRDAGTGSLSALASLGDVGLVSDVVAIGDRLYVSTGDALKVYLRQGENLVEQDSETAQAEFAQLTALQLSSDGQFLFAGVSGSTSLASVFRINADGSLTHVADATADGGEHFVSAIALSADGQSLYALDNGNALYTLTIASDGRLGASGTPVELSAGSKQIIVSQDGNALIITGAAQIELFTRNGSGTFALSQAYSSFDGSNLDELRSASLSSDGSQIYLSGEFSWNQGLLVLDLQAASSSFTEGGNAVVVLPGGTLADTRLDALNDGQGDYNGASIVVARENGAQAEDRFSFIDNANLSLSGEKLLLDGVAIADFTQAQGTLTLAFIASLSQADAQKVLRGIAYSNSSNDPAAQANLRMTFSDGDAQSTSRIVDVTLQAVNDPAIVETTILHPTFNAEGERVPLFENTSIDTVEAGQTIWYVALTIDAVRPGDVLGVGNGRIALDGPTGVGTTGTGQQYNIIRHADGTTSVWVYTTGRPVAEVEALVDSLTFEHTGNDVSGQRTIALAFREMANENQLTTVADKAVVTLSAALTPNSAPTLNGVSPTVPYTEQASPVALVPAATLGDTELQAFNGGQGNYNGATLTITLGVGKSNSDSLGFLGANGLSIAGDNLQKDGLTIGHVSLADGVMTITFSDASGSAPTGTDVQNTLRQITYANGSDVPGANVAVSITLADQRGLSVERSLSIAITAVNDAPVINDDPIRSLGDLESLQDLRDIPGLSAPTSSTLSTDGSRVYVADGQGNIALFSRDAGTGELSHVQTFAGQTGIVELQLTSDGSMLYALQENGSNSVITWFAVDADGRLQQQESLSGLWNIQGMSLSDDGRNLYLINQNTISAYSRDTASGALDHLGDLVADMDSAPYLWSPTEIASRGNLVFVVTNPGNGSSLIVYERDTDGNLTAPVNIRSGNSDATGKTVNLSNVQHIAVSADGRTIFVANSRTSSVIGGWGTPVETVIHNHPQQVDGFSLDPATGALTHLGTISDTPTVEDIALSADGKALFITRNDGSLAYHSAITLEKLPSSQAGLAGADRLAVSADGAVIVTGSRLLVFNAPAMPGPGGEIGGAPAILFPAIELNDAELDAADNYQGANVTISGQAGDVFGFRDNATYTAEGERILRGGVEVATFAQTSNRAVLSFTSAISGSDANALLRQITYVSASGTPGNHGIELVMNDGEADSPARTIEFTLLPANQAPVWSGPDGYAPVAAEAGKAYSVVLPNDLFNDAEGDALTWSVQGLPPGLTFNALTRTLSGSAPTEVGNYGFTLTATDGRGATAEHELTLDVVNSAPQIGIAYSLDSAQSGLAYSATLAQNLFTDANDSELNWELELPEWLTYDAATRTLSGTAPDVAGSHSITITATDPHGATVSRTLTLAVALPVQDTGEAALPELNTGFQQQPNTAPTASFGGQALNAPLFGASDAPANTPTEAPTSAQPAPTVQSLLRSSGNGLADGRGSLSQQLANAAGVITDSGYQNTGGSFSFDGARFNTSVDLNASSERSVSLKLPVELPNGGTAQRITLANGLPLPSWASFDARSGELRIDRERLQRDGVLRLTLISRDGEGREQRTPLDIRAEGAAAQSTSEALQQPAPAAESLPERMRQDTSNALLSEALELLDQLSDLAGEPVAVTTRHIA